jgi:hypothetical protein
MTRRRFNMSSTLGAIENEIYVYLNKKYKHGWTNTTLENYYNKLDYFDAKKESDILSTYFKAEIRLSDMEDIDKDKSLGFTVRRLATKIYNAREAMKAKPADPNSVAEDGSTLMVSEGGFHEYFYDS